MANTTSFNDAAKTLENTPDNEVSDDLIERLGFKLSESDDEKKNYIVAFREIYPSITGQIPPEEPMPEALLNIWLYILT